MKQNFLQIVMFAVVMLAGVISFQNQATMNVAQVFAHHNPNHQQPRIRICHSTNSHSNPYSNIEVDQDAVDGDLGNDNGQGDHYLEHNGPPWYSGIADHSWGDVIPPIPNVHNGKNWTAEGQAFWNNACNIPLAASPSSSPSVSPSPSPSVSPSPSPTPSIGGPEVGRRSSIGYDANCNENFDVVMDLTDNGNPVENVEVTFDYKGHDATSNTNQDGRARVSYRKDGEGAIRAEADGFPGADVYATFRTDCPSTGSVLGATTETKRTGKVLGASTLANTGSADVYQSLMVLGAGVLMMVVSLRYYIVAANHAHKKN